MKHRKQIIDEIVRDFTSVVPRSKSELRKRLDELLTIHDAYIVKNIINLKHQTEVRAGSRIIKHVLLIPEISFNEGIERALDVIKFR